MSLIESDSSRLAALMACAVLDTPREAMFDNVVFTAAQLMRTRCAMLALVAPDRIWAKAAVGLAMLDWDRAEVHCRTVVATGEPLIVVDDAAVAGAGGEASAGLVGRFCAAVPVHGPGKYRIGCLCVIDNNVRAAAPRQMLHLRQLGEQLSDLLKLRVPGLNLLD